MSASVPAATSSTFVSSASAPTFSRNDATMANSHALRRGFSAAGSSGRISAIQRRISGSRKSLSSQSFAYCLCNWPAIAWSEDTSAEAIRRIGSEAERDRGHRPGLVLAVARIRGGLRLDRLPAAFVAPHADLGRGGGGGPPPPPHPDASEQ